MPHAFTGWQAAKAAKGSFVELVAEDDEVSHLFPVSPQPRAAYLGLGRAFYEPAFVRAIWRASDNPALFEARSGLASPG